MSASERTPNEVRALREAYVRGALDREQTFAAPDPDLLVRPAGEASPLRVSLAAKRLYPMPTVTVPRVVSEGIGGVSYKIDRRDDGLSVLFVCCDAFTGGNWKQVMDAPHSMDVSRLTLVASLLANPTETREAP